MHVEDLLYAMRTNTPQPAERIAAFVRGVTDGTVSRPQAAAWLAWAFARGLTDAETLALTQEMTRSGEVLSWGEGGPTIDKHSTGGVGDKVSLILAPLWAELGYRVPMLSGRGLGHTGGTLDKLEAIPGYRTDVPVDGLRRILGDVGCFISGQTAQLAPADRVLYALRNETCTVESIPLICGSILSKKLAEGAQQLVLDVKVGSGAFMKTYEDAHKLGDALVRIATGAGVKAGAMLTAMERPLGEAVGNANEVVEAIACLRGEGPADLRELTLALAVDARAQAALDSGRALERFAKMIEAQGGDPRVVDEPARLLGGGVDTHVVRATRSGVLRAADAWHLGRAAFVLGAGRRRAEDPVDFGVGLRVIARPGDEVRAGDALVEVAHRGGHALGDALAMIGEAMVIGDGAPVVPPLIQARLGAL